MSAKQHFVQASNVLMGQTCIEDNPILEWQAFITWTTMVSGV